MGVINSTDTVLTIHTNLSTSTSTIWRIKYMMLRRFALASVLLIASSAAPAMADTATANLNVTASVGATCSITTTPLYFGNFTAGANKDVNASVITNCTTGLVGAKVTLSQGANAAGGSTDSAPLRRLTDGATTPNYLSYFLYTDAPGGNVWGNTDATSETIPPGTGANQTTPIYGRIPSAGNSSPVAGNYTDTVVATITY